MLILDLTIFSLQERGGISVVWGEYLKRLPEKIADSEQIEVLLPPANNIVLNNLDLSSFKQKKLYARGKYSKYLPSLLRGSETDILHMSYYGWYPLYRGKKVITLHDFTHELYAKGFQKILHNLLKRVSIMSSDVILCISETTKADLKHYYPDAVANKQVFVIPNAVSENFYSEPMRGSNEGGAYLLWVGGRSGYKNFELALQCLRMLRNSGEEIELIVVGPPFSQEEIVAINDLGLDDAVEIHANVDNQRLRQLYSDALALLYLSKYEGFGLPILEAQQCRCPVICIPVPACKEVGRETALFLKEDKPELIVDMIKNLRHPDERRKVIESGVENTKRYSWDKSVDALVHVYRNIVSVG